MAHRPPKIKRKSKDTNHLANKESIKTIADNATGDTNLTVSAAGTVTSGKAVTLGTKITVTNNARIAAKSATSGEKTANSNAVDSYNGLVTVIEMEYPDNPDKWLELGCEVTDADTHDAVKYPPAEHCSVTQGEALGTADVHHDPIPGSDHNKVLVTNGSATDRSKYIDVTNPDESASKSNHTVNLTAEYIGVPLFWIVVGSNTAGDGYDSVAFGGGRKIN